MTKRELWLKLFSENDTALAAAIHLCERFVSTASLKSGQDFLVGKRAELYEEVERETVRSVFPNIEETHQDHRAELVKILKASPMIDTVYGSDGEYEEMADYLIANGCAVMRNSRGE